MTDYYTGKYVITQTWKQHIANAGPSLGGVDYKMSQGTHLKSASAGVFEWVTPLTLFKPRWYNTGLGYAAAVRRPDGTRTIFGHCSKKAIANGSKVTDGQVIAYSGGAPGTPGAGKSTGPHLHTHDVLSNGTTRVYPFSTAPSGGGSGGGGKNEGNDMFRIILTKRGSTSSANLYDVFTDYETLTSVPWDEARAYNTMADITTGSIDGTSSASSTDRAIVASTRKLWARIQETNKRNLVSASWVAPVIDLDALAAKVAALLPAAPTVDEIAAKVIEYQKLPGN
jgi:hypothetical protein